MSVKSRLKGSQTKHSEMRPAVARLLGHAPSKYGSPAAGTLVPPKDVRLSPANRRSAAAGSPPAVARAVKLFLKRLKAKQPVAY